MMRGRRRNGRVRGVHGVQGFPSGVCASPGVMAFPRRCASFPSLWKRAFDRTPARQSHTLLRADSPQALHTGTRDYWQRNSTVARAMLPGAASVPGLASVSLDATTTAVLPRCAQYSSALLTRRAFSSAPVLTRPDEPATRSVPFGPGVTNDLDPHPANATIAAQSAQRQVKASCRSFVMDSPVGMAPGMRGRVAAVCMASCARYTESGACGAERPVKLAASAGGQ